MTMAETTKPATMREHWQTALAVMQRSYPAATALYLQRLQPVAYQAGTLTVAAPDELTRDMGLRLRRVIGQHLTATAGRDVAIEYVIQDGGVPC
jgi:hypothetical protein